METVVVVARVDRLGDLGLDFHRDLVGGQHVEPGAVADLAQRQRRRQRRRGGVGEQPVDAVLGDRELGVVVIVGVDRDAVGEGGEARPGPSESVPMTVLPLSVGQPSVFRYCANDVARFGGVAGEREPDAVEDRALAEVHHIGRDAGTLSCSDDEFGDVGGERTFRCC